jgi:hypothetical protein
MGRQIILQSEIDEVWALFYSLSNKGVFFDLCRLAVNRNFIPEERDVIRCDSSILSSRDQAKLLPLIDLLIKIKLADFNIFIHLLSEICQKMVCNIKPLVPFTSKDGRKVCLDPGGAFERRLLAYFPICLNHIDLSECPPVVVKNINLEEVVGRHVGLCLLVETGEQDEVIYGKRNATSEVTRYVAGRQPDPTHYIWLSMINHPDADNCILRKAAFGKRPPITPNKTNRRYRSLDSEKKRKSREFWRTHAYILPPNPLALKLASAPPEWEI